MHARSTLDWLQSKIFLVGLYQPTHGTTQRGRPRLNYVDYVKRLTGMKSNKLVEMSQDREAWRELVVACTDPQPPDQRERTERERTTSRG